MKSFASLHCGYRCILTKLKQAAACGRVYSFCFGKGLQRWRKVDWRHCLRGTIIKSVDNVIGWMDKVHPPLHRGDSVSVHEILMRTSNHHVYHAGEINQLRSIWKNEAWGDGEENNSSTLGRRVRSP